MGEVRIDFVGGAMPVQAEGEMFGSRFYFRARHGEWSLSVAKPGYSPFSPGGKMRLYLEGEDKTHGWMREGDVMDIIRRASEIMAICDEQDRRGQAYIVLKVADQPRGK